MGHYRSKMGYEKEDAAREKHNKKRLKKIRDNIEKSIKKRGLVNTLADIYADCLEYGPDPEEYLNSHVDD